MKIRTRFLAGLLSAAILMQGAAALPSARPLDSALTAAAASVRSIQTRVFAYDFGSFQALYDNKTARWYTTEGTPIVSQTEDVQRVENPFFGNADYNHGGSAAYAIIVHMTDMTIELEFEDGTLLDLDELAAAFESPVRSSTRISQILEITPEYNPQYYDKAQQLYADVPEPQGFPLTYVWRIAEGEFQEQKVADLYCDIYFGDNLYGSCLCEEDIIFTKAADIADEGSADPFTDTGDVSIDGAQDVSDAVLTSRVVGEIEDTEVSDLGMELADKDGDGLLTGNDALDIIRDIAGVGTSTDPPSRPAQAVPVIQLEYPHDDAETLASLFGYESAAALEETIMQMDINVRSFAQCTAGDAYDIWDFAYYADDGGWHQAALRTLTFDETGALLLDALTCYDPDSDVQMTDRWDDPMRWIQVRVTVPHGALPATMQTQYDWTFTARSAPFTVPQISYIRPYTDGIRAEVLAESMPLFDSVQEDAFAELEGSYESYVFRQYRDAADTEDETLRAILAEGKDILAVYTMRSDVCHTLGAVSAVLEGDELSLTLADHHTEQILPAIDRIRILLITEDGALPALNTVNVTVQNYADLFGQSLKPEFLNAVKNPLYIQSAEYDVPEGAIPVYSFRQLHETDDALAAAFGYASYENMQTALEQAALEQSEHIKNQPLSVRMEGAQFDTWNLALFQVFYREGFFGANIRTMHLDENGILQIAADTGELPVYTPSSGEHSMGGLLSGSQYLWVQITVPHGALPRNLQTQWNLTSCELTATATPRYITVAETPEYTGNTAVVQVDSRFDYGDGSLISEEIAAELKTPEDIAFRQYFEPEDADSEELQAILAQGKDVLAVYLLRSSGGAEFGVMRAERWRDTLNLMLAEHRELTAAQAFEYHRIMLITEDGALPDINTVNVDVAQVYQDRIREAWNSKTGEYDRIEVNTRPDFEATICNPVEIKEYADSCIQAQVKKGGNLSIEERELIKEASAQGKYTFVKLLREPADTDDEIAQEILEHGTQDILAVYIDFDYLYMKFGITDVYADETGTLHIGIASHSTNPIEAQYGPGYRLLICVEKGALPDFSDYEATITRYLTPVYGTYEDEEYTDYLKAIHNSVYISIPEQTPQQPAQIALRGDQAGIATVWREREELPDPEVRFDIEPLREDAATDTDEDDWGLDFTWKILHDYVYWQNGIPELTNGDLFCAMDFENAWRGWVGVQSAVLSGDGVLHLTLARCEGEGEYAKDDEEGDCTAVVICMLGETGAFAAIQDVQLAYADYDSYEAYAQALPQHLSIQLQ